MTRRLGPVIRAWSSGFSAMSDVDIEAKQTAEELEFRVVWRGNLKEIELA